jgi:hypothetical protein
MTIFSICKKEHLQRILILHLCCFGFLVFSGFLFRRIYDELVGLSSLPPYVTVSINPFCQVTVGVLVVLFFGAKAKMQTTVAKHGQCAINLLTCDLLWLLASTGAMIWPMLRIIITLGK